MAGDVTILKGATGLNNRVDTHRLPADFETAMSDLGVAVNVVIDNSYMVSRSSGHRKIHELTAAHSLFCDGGDCLVCDGTRLYQVLSDLTTLGVRSGLSGRRMTYKQVGDRIYYSDAVSKNGYVLNGISSPWAEQKYLAETDRVFSKAPIAAHMDMLNGRMYIVPEYDRRLLVWSERGQIGLYNLGENARRFESDIIMVAAARQGLFVSTTERTVFLRIDANGINLEPRTQYPAVEYSLAHSRVEAKDAGVQLQGGGRLWRGLTGACFGADSGEILNLTEDKIKLPAGCSVSGASLVVGDFYYHSSKG